MLYTRKGDNGTTKTFGCDQRISKSGTVAEALGTLDELNSFLGICKVKSSADGKELMHWLQENLFIVQAQVAGADKKMDAAKVKKMEEVVDGIEKVLPPIKTFFIAGGRPGQDGGDELSAYLDFARTLARRAERRVVGVMEEKLVNVEPETLAFLNRLSSVLYALARLANHKSGITEVPPNYL